MADNTAVTNGSGDIYRSLDRSGVKTDVVGIDVGIGTADESLLSPAHPMPVSLASAAEGAYGIWALVSPSGSLRTTGDPSTEFCDFFDGVVINTTDYWTLDGTQAPTQDGKAIIQATVGASVSNYSMMTTKDIFGDRAGWGFTCIAFVMSLEAAQINAVNVHRFVGRGQSSSYTYDTPLTDGCGFEVDGDTGAIQCVIYAGGTKYVINSSTPANVSSSVAYLGGSGTALPSGAVGSAYGAPLTWPGGLHRYAVLVRADITYWFIEGIDVPVAVLSYATPNVQGCPIRIAAITNPSDTSLDYTMTVGALAVGDGSQQNMVLGDGNYPRRRASITMKGNQGATALGTQDLKDGGRTSIAITASAVSTAATETLISITRSKGLAATGTSTSTNITSGKKFRIQSIVAVARNTSGTTAGVATIRIRGAVAGATSITSPLQFTSSVALPASVVSVQFPNASIPDGFEIDSNGGTNTYGVTILHPQRTAVVIATFDISIIGFEY